MCSVLRNTQYKLHCTTSDHHHPVLFIDYGNLTGTVFGTYIFVGVFGNLVEFVPLDDDDDDDVLLLLFF